MVPDVVAIVSGKFWQRGRVGRHGPFSFRALVGHRRCDGARWARCNNDRGDPEKPMTQP